jgi:hypothetical protein
VEVKEEASRCETQALMACATRTVVVAMACATRTVVEALMA